MTKQELATKIWATANELRKNIKASEYKDYILGFMFYKYLSDKEIDYLISIGGESAEDLKDADNDMKEMFRDSIGYFISYDDLFRTWKKEGIKLGAKNVAEALENFYLNLNESYSVVFDKVFSALQSGLTKLGENAGSRDKAVRDIVELVDLIPPTSTEYDVLGYIYEYLIQQFSSEAKKDGAFYTPHELTSLASRCIAERVKDKDEVYVYDPTVGSAGLLLNIGKEVGRYIDKDNIHYYGQELITETANLAKMNLFMQGVPVQNICIRNANTLEEDWPYFDANTPYSPLFVDAVVSNPPYSARWDSFSHRTDARFKNYGLAPDTKADYAFLLHCLYHIKQDGVMAIVLPHGVLFRGGSEGEIRKNLIENNNIETIIGFPSQLFFATGIPVIIAILSKGRKTDDILFIDASKGFKKDKKQNVLRECDVQRIFDAIQKREDIEGFAHLASKEEIIQNDYNLNIPRYVSAEKKEMPFDLYSVMTGLVSEAELSQFDEFWNLSCGLKEKLFDKEGAYYRYVAADIKETVTNDADIEKFKDSYQEISDDFKDFLIEELIQNDPDKHVYEKIKNVLFEAYKNNGLVDVYQIYQAMSECWPVIESDLARISAEGRSICSETEPNMVMKKDSKTKKTEEEQKGYKGKVFPFDLIKTTYFDEDYKNIARLNSEADSCNSEYTEIWESLEEDVIQALSKDAEDSTDFDEKKIKAAIKAKDYDKEILVELGKIVNLVADEKVLKKEAKNIADSLDNKAKGKIESLTEEEVYDLLVLKWIEPVIKSVNDAAASRINTFISELNKLKEKYSDPLAELSVKQKETENALKESLAQLVGSDEDMMAIRMLMEELG